MTTEVVIGLDGVERKYPTPSVGQKSLVPYERRDRLQFKKASNGVEMQLVYGGRITAFVEGVVRRRAYQNATMRWEGPNIAVDRSLPHTIGGIHSVFTRQHAAPKQSKLSRPVFKQGKKVVRPMRQGGRSDPTSSPINKATMDRRVVSIKQFRK
jgi:hypothetical protein